MRIKYQYRKSKWWKFIHYNYFHKRLFKEFYVRKRKFTDKQIKKYYLFQKLDDLITLRKIKWIRNIIFRLDNSL